MTKAFCFFVSVLLIAVVVESRPQGPLEAPEPYEYQYKVEDQPTNVYFGANELGDAQGKVSGSYFVWLPDGRLMTVEYTVDGDSGFVPKITFQDNAQPLSG